MPVKWIGALKDIFKATLKVQLISQYTSAVAESVVI